MNYFINFLTVLANATHLLAANNARLYLLLSAVGLVSGAALWFASNVFGQLFYKPYRLTWGQHCLCGVLAMMMTLCIPLFAASTYLKPSFEAIISVWRDQLSNDRTWQHEQFNRQYYAVKKQGHEDFSHSPPPEQGGKSMPLTHPETIVSTSKMTAEAALENFRQNFPLLRSLSIPLPTCQPRRSARMSKRISKNTQMALIRMHKASSLPLPNCIRNWLRK